ncbi:hypothetical protein [Nocardioides sp.]|uniref:hypothetical protein n=1 Tax=Nocardioides sp. TaxID=35761 RepID=UPI00260A4B8E|nr:hypothetical protein [Nocardioides sp.]MCW2738730.1 hypothetical protein [Nocardioides sp.]
MLATDAPRRDATVTRYWFIGAVLCVFGPYLVGGLRTEQLAMYASAAVAVVLHRRHLRVLMPGRAVLVLWAAYVLVAAVGGLVTESRLEWGSGSLVAGLDNALLPLATMTAVALWMRSISPLVMLRTASWVVVSAMAINAALAVLTSLVGVDNLPFLRVFWAASGAGPTVAELAAVNGRFSGVFNQPAEAGIAYSLAAFCLIYLVRSGASVPRRVWLVLCALVILGGVMTLSKIFIIGGLLIALGLVLTARPHRRLLTVGTAVVVASTFTLGALGWLGTWGAAGMLSWYVQSAQAGNSWAYTLTAGRFGAGGNELPPEVPDSSPGLPTEFQQPGGLVKLARAVLMEHPWFGVGARGLPVSYDSTWIEAVVVAGVVGVLLVFAVHVLLAIRLIRLRRFLPHEEWRLATAVVLLVAGSSFGMPSLTGNREGTLLWIFLAILLVFRRPGTQWDRTLDSAP